ncbi:hypothetical protein [Desulfuromonas sp. TF]|uniref:hypothetical protein n=1 Tax=Desulfuromonas sp. TF TaxID=1232410 RepID=UPI00040B59B2|nr:hypothetical protein [Desulfuromonas sp. TF]
MAEMTFAAALRSSRAQQIADDIDAGAGPGVAKLYTGAKPAACGAISTQTLLGTVTCSDPCGTVTAGVLTFSDFTQDDGADADGTAGFLRFEDSDGNAVADLNCGATGSGKPVELNTVTIFTGGPIDIVSAVITEGNA